MTEDRLYLSFYSIYKVKKIFHMLTLCVISSTRKDR